MEGFWRFMKARMDQPVWLPLYLGPATFLIEPRTCVCLKCILLGSNHIFGWKTSSSGESTVSPGTLLLLDALLINFRITNDFSCHAVTFQFFYFQTWIFVVPFLVDFQVLSHILYSPPGKGKFLIS